MFSNKKLTAATIIAFLVSGFIFTTTSAFSYWQEVTLANDVEIVNIGEPVEIIVTDLNTAPENVYLVPSGYAIAVDHVEFVTLTYQVGVSEELLNIVNLIVTADSILINDDDTYSHLIDINIMNMGSEATLDLFNDSISISVVVRLIEPIDEAEANELGLDPSRINVEDSVAAYEAIQGQDISFQLLFELENKE